jgi:hypothetical protein
MSAPDLDGRIAVIAGRRGSAACARLLVADVRGALRPSEEGVRRLQDELGADRTIALPMDV